MPLQFFLRRLESVARKSHSKMVVMVGGGAEAVLVDGVGFCSSMNSRGLLESLSVRAQVGCPPPADKDQALVWLREGTM